MSSIVLSARENISGVVGIAITAIVTTGNT
jgi:hypothetical protein